MAKSTKNSAAARNIGGLFATEEVEEVNRETLWMQAERKVLACTSCSLSARPCTKPIMGRGRYQRPLLAFLLEAPSAQDNEAGEVLTSGSTSGALFDRLLGAMGLQRDQVLLAYAVSCHIPDTAPPGESLLEACEPNWSLQLEVARPRLILACGWAATAALLGESRAEEKQYPAWQRCMQQAEWQYWRTIPWQAIHHPSSMVTAPRTRAATFKVLSEAMDWLAKVCPDEYQRPPQRPQRPA
jgi:uracil-DNA glycosylase family 4